MTDVFLRFSLFLSITFLAKIFPARIHSFSSVLVRCLSLHLQFENHARETIPYECSVAALLRHVQIDQIFNSGLLLLLFLFLSKSESVSHYKTKRNSKTDLIEGRRRNAMICSRVRTIFLLIVNQ